MKKLINLNIFLILFLSFFHVSALETSTWAIVKIYNNFIFKLESKLSIENQLKVLETLSTKLESKLKSKSISTKSIILLKELDSLNDNKIYEIKQKLNFNSYLDNDQIKVEQSEKQKFNDIKKISILPDYITSLISLNRPYIYVNYSESTPFFEFLDKDKIKRLIFTNYFEITNKNYDLFKGKNWYILQLNWKYVFVENYEIEEKIPYSNSSTYFKWIVLNQSYNYHQIWSDYYTFKFNTYNYIDDKYGFYPKSLLTLWIDTKKTILYKNIDKYVFVTSFSEQKLVNSEIIKSINDKGLFLSFVIDDKKWLDYDTDKYFVDLKATTEKLTSNLSRDEKIKKIYDYILKNVSYTNPIDLTSSPIFSWIDTFKNKDWVCEWYVKLMAYMLMFSWIEDVEVIRWFVINASDFPKVWHAWLKIWTNYYDPTFDDPIWNTIAKEYSSYDYFKLPADLIYTNRYDVSDLPEDLKTKSKTELNNIVNKNLYDLVPKYKNSSYNLIKYSLFLYNNWFSYSDILTPQSLESFITTYNIDWKDMSYVKNWRKYFIKKLKFYQINSENLKDVLSAINFDFSWKTLLKWDLWNWSYEYRLAYEFEIF